MVYFQGCSVGCCDWNQALGTGREADGFFLRFCWALSIRLAGERSMLCAEDSKLTEFWSVCSTAYLSCQGGRTISNRWKIHFGKITFCL